jgi:hypothetical protein
MQVKYITLYLIDYIYHTPGELNPPTLEWVASQQPHIHTQYDGLP